MAAERRSYTQILKSSVMIGGSSLVNIGIGIVRTKAMALLLGPSGVGLAGLYGSIADVSISIAGMGVNSSGVRQIAEAVGSGDTTRIARTAAVLRWTSVALGILGAALLIAFSGAVSRLTFGTSEHILAVCLLAAAVLLRVVADAQTALIQGMRRIGDLAKISIFGALTGTLVGVPLVYFFGKGGIAPSLVTVAAATLLTSWWYRRGIRIPKVPISASEATGEAAALLKLGAAFMASGLMMMGSAYVIRMLILRWEGFEATGLYQSAWTLGGLYVGFILQAMGADFYPRLTALANDNASCNRLVNEQAHVGLLLAGPGVIATITTAPAIMAVLYTTTFEGAVPILRWICLGMTLRVINWPMGFIILAKGRQDLLIWTDVAWLVAHIGLAWVCIRQFGVNGAGIAFFSSYVVHGCLVYPIVRHISGFTWSGTNKHLAALFLPLIALAQFAFYVLPFALAAGLGALLTLLASVYSGRRMLTLVPLHLLPTRSFRVR